MMQDTFVIRNGESLLDMAAAYSGPSKGAHDELSQGHRDFDGSHEQPESAQMINKDVTAAVSRENNLKTNLQEKLITRSKANR